MSYRQDYGLLFCPLCEGEIKRDLIDFESGVAHCDACKVTLPVGELVEEKYKIEYPPEGAWYHQEHDKLVIGGSLYHKWGIPALAFGCLLAVAMMQWTGSGFLMPTPGEMLTSAGVFLCGAFILLYGKVEVTIGPEGGRVFTGVYKIGYFRRFRWEDIDRVLAVHISVLGEVPKQGPAAIALAGKEKNIEFGKLLREDRRMYMLHVLRSLLMQKKWDPVAFSQSIRGTAASPEGRGNELRQKAEPGRAAGAKPPIARIQCVFCDGEINPDYLNMEEDLAYCEKCEAEMPATTLLAAQPQQPLDQPPAGGWYRRERGKVTLGAGLRTPWFGLGMTVVFLFAALVAGDGGPGQKRPLYVILIIALGLCIGLYTLFLPWGRTEIILTPDGGSIFTGLYKIGLTSSFDWEEIDVVTELWEGDWWKKSSLILRGPDKRIKFGSLLTKKHYHYLRESLHLLLLKDAWCPHQLRAYLEGTDLPQEAGKEDRSHQGVLRRQRSF